MNCWVGNSFMMNRLYIAISFLFLSVTAFAQRTEKVETEYIYHAPENISLEEAKQTALERAKIEALKTAFGESVDRITNTLIENENGKSDVNVSSLGQSQVRGEWVETIGEPTYDITYDQGMLVIKVSVKGRIREITNDLIEFAAKVLRNGTELKYAQTDFHNGDDLFLHFQTPIDGYLTVYLYDAPTEMVYCLLPYRGSSDAVVSVEKDKAYIFFSMKHAEKDAHLVDEYQLTCEGRQALNTIFVIFSPNEFTKSNSTNVDVSRPMELSYDDFRKWLVKSRNRDKRMNVREIPVTITSIQ